MKRLHENQAQLTGTQRPKDLVHAQGQMCLCEKGAPSLQLAPLLPHKALPGTLQSSAVRDKMSYRGKMAQKIGLPFCRTRRESQFLLAGWDRRNVLVVPLLSGLRQLAIA